MIFEQAEEFGVEHSWYKEAQEQKSRDTAVLDSSQEVTISIFGTGSDMPKDEP
jgi:hypothetical protein